MFVIQPMRLNKKVDVKIPSPANLFARFGMTSRKGTYSGDDTPDTGLSKVEQAAAAEKLIIDKEK